MLRITEDARHGCLILEPKGPLNKGDIEALGERFGARTAATGRPPNLVIHAGGFPAWTDLQALLLHLRFIRTHHRQVQKVAIVSDSRALDIAPRIARLVVAAEVRHFADRDLDAALAWVAEPEPPRGHVSLIEGLPDDVIGLSVDGVIEAKDYAETIVPLIEAKLATHEGIKFLYRIGPGFERFTSGAIWSDAEVGIKHLTRFSRVALVSDIGWIRHAVRAFAPMIPAEVQVFAEADLKAAEDWISA